MNFQNSLRLVQLAAEYLAQKGFEEPRLTAEVLLADTLGWKRLDLYLRFDRPLSAEEVEEFRVRVRRRLRHEPVQYIAGTAEFRHLVLKVDRRVLIPRPETEVLVDEVLAWAKGKTGLDVADIGTGSGAIAISLRTEGDFGRVVATDLSPDALAVARANLERIAPDADIEFRQGYVLEPLGGDRFDLIVSNPPYVAEADRAKLPVEVREWEPAGALFGGADGLDIIRELVKQSPDHLRPRGLLAMEVGVDQVEKVARMVQEAPTFVRARVRSDLTGRERIVLAELS